MTIGELIAQFKASRAAIVSTLTSQGPAVDASGPRPIIYHADADGRGFTETLANSIDTPAEDAPANPPTPAA